MSEGKSKLVGRLPENSLSLAGDPDMLRKNTDFIAFLEEMERRGLGDVVTAVRMAVPTLDEAKWTLSTAPVPKIPEPKPEGLHQATVHALREFWRRTLR